MGLIEAHHLFLRSVVKLDGLMFNVSYDTLATSYDALLEVYDTDMNGVDLILSVDPFADEVTPDILCSDKEKLPEHQYFILRKKNNERHSGKTSL